MAYRRARRTSVCVPSLSKSSSWLLAPSKVAAAQPRAAGREPAIYQGASAILRPSRITTRCGAAATSTNRETWPRASPSSRCSGVRLERRYTRESSRRRGRGRCRRRRPPGRRTSERYADFHSCDRADGERYMESLGGRGSVAVQRTCMTRGDLTSKPSSKAPILVSRFRFVGLQSGQQYVRRHRDGGEAE